MGNALVGSLFYNLKQKNVPVWLDSPLQELIVENGKITGAKITRNGKTVTVKTRQGVVLATGGIGWNQKLRQKLFPKGLIEESLAPMSNTGDGLITAMQIGAKLDPSVRVAFCIFHVPFIPIKMVIKPFGRILF
jgi:aspartate oxidase